MELKITEAECGSVELLLGALRRQGWLVGVHNDYYKDGQLYTFWLLTNPATNTFVKGETSGPNMDLVVLLACIASIRSIRDWMPGSQPKFDHS